MCRLVETGRCVYPLERLLADSDRSLVRLSRVLRRCHVLWVPNRTTGHRCGLLLVPAALVLDRSALLDGGEQQAPHGDAPQLAFAARRKSSGL